MGLTLIEQKARNARVFLEFREWGIRLGIEDSDLLVSPLTHLTKSNWTHLARHGRSRVTTLNVTAKRFLQKQYKDRQERSRRAWVTARLVSE